MRHVGLRRRGPPAGRLFRAPPRHREPRRLSGVQAGWSPFQLASRGWRGVVLVSPPPSEAGRDDGGGARALPRVTPFCRRSAGFLGLLDRTRLCDGRVAPRATRCPKPREAPVLASVRVPVGAGRKQRWAAGRSSRERNGRSEGETAYVGAAPARAGLEALLPRAARGASPSAAAAGAAFGFPCRPSALLQSEPPRQGASVAGSRPPRRVAVSSSTSGAPAAVGGGKRVPSSSPASRVFLSLCVPAGCDRPRSAAGPASGAGQPRPARRRAEQAPRRPRVVPPRVSPPCRETTGARCRRARASKELLSGPGSSSAASREGAGRRGR